MRFTGSCLYAASAALVLFGFVQILRGLFGGEWETAARIASFGFLNAYEAELLAGVLLLAARRAALDDAISLAVLAGVFLVGSSAALATIAPTDPGLAMILGAAGLLLAAAKVRFLSRALGRFGAGLSAALLVLLAADLLGPGLLGLALSSGRARFEMLPAWILLWCALASGVAMLIPAARMRPAGAPMWDRGREAFLESPAMRWTFALVVAAASGGQAWLLADIFGVPVPPSVLLPIMGAMAVAVFALRAGWLVDAAAAIAALAAVVACRALAEPRGADAGWLGFLGRPGGFALAMAVLLSAWGVASRRGVLVTAALGFWAAGPWLGSAGDPASIPALPVDAAAFVLAGAFLLLWVRFRHVGWLFASLAAAFVGLAAAYRLHPDLRGWALVGAGFALLPLALARSLQRPEES